MKGFTKTGEPIQGRKYTLTQGDLVIPVTVVAKGFGAGSGDLILVVLEEKGGARTPLPWPIEATPGSDPIQFTYGWPEEST